jgi:hypothetical protein
LNTEAKRPVLFNSDPSSIAKTYLPDPVNEDDLRRLIDMMADSGITHYCQEAYSQCCTAWWRCETYTYDHRPQHERFLPLLESGVQPLEVLADQCHQRGLRFIAGIRVNDTHGYKRSSGENFPWYGDTIESVVKKNPEWELKEFEEARSDDVYALDFTADGVRDFTAGVIKELIDRFDLDGIEFCYRDFGYFPAGTGPERAHLMTDFIRQIREHLDKKEMAAGRKLLLGARVYPTLRANTRFGLDVAAWVKEGLLNYLSPMDTMWTDLNLPFEQFSNLTKDTDCELWPGLLPWSSQRHRIRLRAAMLTPANCRAYTHSCYENGADGMSLFNVCTLARCYPFFPQNLQISHQLGNPDRVAAGERHYIFEPMWVSLSEFETIGDSVRYNRADHIHLVRDELNAAGEAHLNLYENPDDVHSVQIMFRGSGLSEKDELEVKFNGKTIPDREMGRNRRSDASLDDWGDARSTKDGREWACNPEARIDFTQVTRVMGNLEPRYASCSSRWFALDPSMLERGRNVLSMKLLENDPGMSQDIVIDEFEVWVEPK